MEAAQQLARFFFFKCGANILVAKMSQWHKRRFFSYVWQKISFFSDILAIKLILLKVAQTSKRKKVGGKKIATSKLLERKIKFGFKKQMK